MRDANVPETRLDRILKGSRYEKDRAILAVILPALERVEDWDLSAIRGVETHSDDPYPAYMYCHLAVDVWHELLVPHFPDLQRRKGRYGHRPNCHIIHSWLVLPSGAVLDIQPENSGLFTSLTAHSWALVLPHLAEGIYFPDTPEDLSYRKIDEYQRCRQVVKAHLQRLLPCDMQS